MKKILILLILFSFASCASAQVQQKPVYITVAFVQDIISEQAVLSTGYTVPVPDGPLAAENGQLEKGKQYVFWLELLEVPSSGSKRAVVLDYTETSHQAQKNQTAKTEKFKHRKIIR